RHPRNGLGAAASTRPRVHRRPLAIALPPRRGRDRLARAAPVRGRRLGPPGEPRPLESAPMCGICGIVALDGGPVDSAPLAGMSDAIRHRGPDSEGSVVDGPVALAIRRLSIIDLEGGDQPIGNEDGSVQVVYNGELYNYRELRAGLERRGHRFATRSDTEVLVHLYEELGPAFADGLRGMFALALWDARRRRLVLARDRFGIKPLHYGIAGGELRFASELKALPRGEVDLDALEAFLAFNSIPAPLTIWRDTRKLPAGH